MTATLLLGLLNGLSIALLTLGLVLVYKSGRFLNFAHAQLGVTSAMLLGTLVLDHGMNYWLALTLALVVGAAIGGLVELLVIRPLADRGRTALLVATIGVSQVLLAVAFFDALAPDPRRLVTDGYPVPFDIAWEVEGFVLRGQHLLVLICAPLIALGLAFLLRRTATGRAIRAVASNQDAASLAGISVRRTSILTWLIAGALSALTAVLQAPEQASFDAQALGPGLLLRALGAAVLGGLTNLGGAFAAGIGLGLFEAVALDITADSGQAEAALFCVVLIGLLIRGRTIGERSLDEPIELDERPLVIPDIVAHRPLVRHSSRLVVVAFVLIGLVAPHLPPFAASEDRFVLALTVSFALVGLSLTVLTGWAGQVSLGQFAFLGVGAYVAGRLIPDGWSLVGAMLAAGVVGAVIAVLIGLPALRLRGATLALTTLGFAVVAPGWVFRQEWFTDGPAERSLPVPSIAGIGSLDSMLDVYYVALVTLALALAAVGRLRSLAPGFMLIAVRDNEKAAASFGFSPTAVRVVTFALSGFLASVAGVLWATAFRNFQPEQFRPEQSLLMFAIAVVGGLASVWGPVLGAVFLFTIPMFLGDWFKEVFGNTLQISLALAGIGLIVTQLQFPGGLAVVFRGLWQRFLNNMALATEAQRHQVDEAEGSDLPLVVQGVSISFGGIRALDDVDLELRSGEVVGLIGTNGAGKTTLLNVISGALAPDAGSVRARGRELVGLGAEFRAHFGIARSFQDARIFPGLSVREAVELTMSRQQPIGFLAALCGAPWARWGQRRMAGQADVVLARFGLTRYADVLVGELSTGTRRICDLACQSATAPRVLLLDEPTAGVAQREAEAFVPLIRQLRDELDCTILLIEHDMPLMMSLADRIYCMHGGKVIAQGTPEQMRTNPLVVASYLGTSAEAIDRSGGRG